MTWKLVDIRQKPEPQARSYAVKGGWEHAVDADCIYLYNGTSFDFNVRHAPCLLSGASRIQKGASGTFDYGSIPWTTRLTRALQAFDMHEGPTVAILDCPPAEHVYEALTALESHAGRINKHRNTDKLLLLCGRKDQTLPVFKDGSMFYSQEQWQRIQSFFHMFVELPFLTNVTKCLEVPLALLLGTYQEATGPMVVQLAYPPGLAVPREMIPFIEFSTNVSSPRVSATQGILLNATNDDEVSAKIVMEITDKALDEVTEDPILTLIRNTFSDDLSKCGAAYFQLQNVQQDSPLYTLAQAACKRVDSVHLSARTQHSAFSRVTSFGAPTKWQ